MISDHNSEEHEGPRPGPEPVTDASGETTARAGAPGLDVQKEGTPVPETDASGTRTARAGGEDPDGRD